MGRWKVLALCGADLAAGAAPLAALRATGGSLGLVILCAYMAIGLAAVSAVRVGHLGRWAVVKSTALSMSVLLVCFAWMIAVGLMIDDHAQPVLHFVVLFGGVVLMVAVVIHVGYRMGLWTGSGKIMQSRDRESATQQRAEPGDRGMA